MKNPFKSKTLWMNVLMGAATILIPQAQDALGQHPAIAGAVMTGANMALRFVSGQPISFTPSTDRFVAGR